MANIEKPANERTDNKPGERKALGRGLAALFQDVQPTAKTQTVEDTIDTMGPGRILYLSEIERNPEQPRKHFNEERLKELAESIAEQGLVQPIVVKKVGNNRYQIVAGERRWRAAGLAGLKQIPVFIREEKTEMENDLASLVENIQREELNPIELAEAYQRILAKDDLTQEVLAKKLGLSRTAIANTLRLLKLPEAIRKMVVEGKISEGHSRALLSLANETQMLQMAQKIVDASMSVRDIETVVRGGTEAVQANLASQANSSKEGNLANGEESQQSADLKALEEELRVLFGTKVRIKGNDIRGMLELYYTGSDSLNRLVHLLRSARK